MTFRIICDLPQIKQFSEKMASKASGGEDKEAMKRAMLERLKERKAASSSASNLLDDEDDDATRRVQSMKAGVGTNKTFSKIFFFFFFFFFFSFLFFLSAWVV
jgi:Fe2+ transport system protein B